MKTKGGLVRIIMREEVQHKSHTFKVGTPYTVTRSLAAELIKEKKAKEVTPSLLAKLKGKVPKGRDAVAPNNKKEETEE